MIHDFFEITNRISSTYKNKTEGGNPSSVNLCGLITDYRNLSYYLKEFSDFIHWYEQMFDHKPFI